MDAEVVRRARSDIGYFAKVVCDGAELWPHQLAAAKSTAPIVALLAGRRAGKSRLISVLGTHTAMSVPGCRVAILSAGERSALRLLRDEVSPLLRSPLLAGSVSDELKGSVTFSNNSIIEVFSASQKAIRGIGARLVVVDEACFVDRDVWISLYPSVLEQLRAGARVVLASSPWPSENGSWFREFHERGLNGDPDVASFTWPSSVNPSIGEAELAHMRTAMSEEEFAREVEARWTSEEGTWFTPEEIEAACLDYPLLSPEAVRARNPWDHETKSRERRFTVTCGLDYGFSQDANSATVLAALEDRGTNPRVVHFVAWHEAHVRMEFESFCDRLLDIGRSYQVYVWASELNGIGSAVGQMLRRRVREEGLGGHVQDVWTDARRKQAAFSKMKAMMQQGTLILPRDPSLMRELRSLDFTRTDTGSLRIAARQGAHDDQAMSLAQGITTLRDIPNPESTLGPMFPHVVTARGTVFPRQPRPREYWTASYGSAQGRERGVEPGW